MELFSSRAELVGRDHEFVLDTDDALRKAVELAWGLRQLSPQRSLELVTQIEHHLSTADESTQRLRNSARCSLIRAEELWLTGNADQASAVLETAVENFREALDLIGLSDASLLSSQIDDERGVHESRDINLQKAARLARAGQDEIRATSAELTLARLSIYQKPKENWDPLLNRAQQAVNEGVGMLAPVLSDFQARMSYSRGDIGAAISHCIDSFGTSFETSQIRRAINAGINAGVYFASLGDSEGASQWLDQATALARQRKWPHSIAGCLYAMGANLAGVAKSAEAETLFREAKALIGNYPASRYSINIDLFLANFELDNGHAQAAGDRFADMVEMAHQLGENDLENKALRGLARAYSLLGMGADAKRVAGTALEHAIKANLPASQAVTLQLLGHIAREYQPTEDVADKPSDSAVGYWVKALELSERHSLHAVELEVLESLASLYAQLGHMTAAYDCSKRMVAAVVRSNQRELSNRAVAAAVREQSERDRLEAEHRRQLAELEEQRARDIEKSQAVLEILASIGQALNSNPDPMAVFPCMAQHLDDLLGAVGLSVYQAQADTVNFRRIHPSGSDSNRTPFDVRLDDLQSDVARCARARVEIFGGGSFEEEAQSNVPGGAEPVRSAMFVPLLAKDLLLGVMAIQSNKPQPYSPWDRHIIRTLSAYATIALERISETLKSPATQTLTDDSVSSGRTG